MKKNKNLIKLINNLIQNIYIKIIKFLLKKIDYNNIKNNFNSITCFYTEDWISWNWLEHFVLKTNTYPVNKCEFIQKNLNIWLISWLYIDWHISKEKYIELHKIFSNK